MKFPDHPVQLNSDDESLQPEQFRSLVEQYKEQTPSLQCFTDDEEAAPYDPLICPVRYQANLPSSDSESSDSGSDEEKHQLTQTT